MIKIELSFAVVLYVGITAVALLLYWVFFEKTGNSRDNHSDFDRYVWQCSICTHFYVDSRHSLMSICPRCRSYNSRPGDSRNCAPENKGSDLR